METVSQPSVAGTLGLGLSSQALRQQVRLLLNPGLKQGTCRQGGYPESNIIGPADLCFRCNNITSRLEGAFIDQVWTTGTKSYVRLSDDTPFHIRNDALIRPDCPLCNMLYKIKDLSAKAWNAGRGPRGCVGDRWEPMDEVVTGDRRIPRWPDPSDEFESDIFNQGQPPNPLILHSKPVPMIDMDFFPENGYLACWKDNPHATRGICKPQLVSKHFDPSLVKRWINVCNERHSGSCHNSLRTKSTSLIDCTTREVVPSQPYFRYVALSYVWGKPTTTPSVGNEGHVFHGSQTIHDAIIVTLALGYHYLWVDQCCIPQDDVEERARQIGQMDQIYRGADLTIIAAAGNDCRYGIPGVGNRPRKKLDCFKFGNHTIAQFPPTAQEVIKNQRWSSRGWTYQEGMLSSRCLVFTDYEMYFECSKAASRESVGGLELVQNNEDLERYESSTLSRDPRIFSFLSFFSRTETPMKSACLDENFQKFQYQVIEYRQRELTYDSDALNAFSGIAQLFQDSLHPVGNLCGIPLTRGESINPLEGYLACGLSWEHVLDTEPDDAAVLSTPETWKLRTQFPSWSWAHHRKPPEAHTRWCLSGRMCIRSHPIGVSVEYVDGGIRNLLDCFPETQTFVPPVMSAPIALHLQAFILPVEKWRHGFGDYEYSDDYLEKDHWQWRIKVPYGDDVVQLSKRNYHKERAGRWKPTIREAARKKFLKMISEGIWSLLFVGEAAEGSDPEGEYHAFMLVVSWQPNGSAVRIGEVSWFREKWTESKSFTFLFSKLKVLKTSIRLV